MTTTQFEELKKSICESEDLGVYDWLCNHSYDIAREELSVIAKELAYALYETTTYHTSKEDKKAIKSELWEALEARVYTDMIGD